MDHFLLLGLGEATYAIEVGKIKEIVESPTVHFVPRAPACFVGAINVHGTVFPVLDLPVHLGYTGSARDHRIVVLAPEVCTLALTVSRVGRIVPCDPERFLPTLEQRAVDSFGRAQFERAGELVYVLDLPRLISSLTF